MVEINLIKSNSDISHAKLMKWDLKIGEVQYDVYRIEGFVHTVGGRFGENNYWACPTNEKPSYVNLIEFNGVAPTWGIFYEPVNYTKEKWGEMEVRQSSSCWITRNGEKFYQITGGELSYCLAKAQYTLVHLEGHPLRLERRDWKECVKGLKIWYNDQPAVISYVTNSNNLWIEPDGIEEFKTPNEWTDGEFEDYKDGLIVDITSSDIGWYREY